MKLAELGLCLLFFMPLMEVGALAQSSITDTGTCPGKIYGPQDVTRRARTHGSLNIKMTKEAAAQDVHGRIVIEAVLCRTGRVTDLKVIEGLPEGMTDVVIFVVRNLKFTPAEKNWHTVSQRMQFEFRINERGAEGIAPRGAAVRLVESIDVMGNRRITLQQILAWIRTRPGESYSPDQVQKDLSALIATGYFDNRSMRVTTEVGVRGGMVVLFEVRELPLINEVKFEGLKQVSQSELIEALRERHVNLEPGAVCEAERIRDAIRLVKEILESRGQSNPGVEVTIQNLPSNKVNIAFVISSN